jgi:hypothetical protein
MRIGFTGTQRGMTGQQIKKVDSLLGELLPLEIHHGDFVEVHHGDCVGADKQFHHLAKAHKGVCVVIHPPESNKKRAFCCGDSIYPPKPYLERNHHLVSITDVLIATPAQYHEKLRSGTWATVRYARKKGKRCLIVLPDGRIK